jgi:ParB/RepB/Spo0J family partition protein
MATVTKALMVPISKIEAPDAYRRKTSAVEADTLRKSIEQGGIQIPLVASRLPNDRYVLIEGYRRLDIAKYLNMTEVPCVIDEIPEGVPPEEYRRRVRFILDEHRQDLLPSQRASLINTLKDRFKMNNKQVGTYLGVDASTIRTWLLVDSLIPEVVEEVDRGTVSLHSARSLEGMTADGQRAAWEENKELFREKKKWSAHKLHRHLRVTYPPDKRPEMYHRPERVLEKLQRPPKKRRGKKRPVIGNPEQKSLLRDLDVIGTEVKENQEEIDMLKREIELAGPVIEAILRNEELRELVPEGMLPELEEFAEARL